MKTKSRITGPQIDWNQIRKDADVALEEKIKNAPLRKPSPPQELSQSNTWVCPFNPRCK